MHFLLTLIDLTIIIQWQKLQLSIDLGLSLSSVSRDTTRPRSRPRPITVRDCCHTHSETDITIYID